VYVLSAPFVAVAFARQANITSDTAGGSLSSLARRAFSLRIL
jgi:hypothetical protein